MLKHRLIHPTINEVLGCAGHHARVLIADGNYPASTAIGPNAELVSLNLSPGIVTCAQVFEVLCTAIPIQELNTMGIPDDDPFASDEDPPVWAEFRRVALAAGLESDIHPIEKWEFYEAVASPEHVLTIQTGEQALWANLLLTIGVREA